MNAHPVSFFGHTLTLLPSGGVWWGAARLLCVSDLHLGKSERMARRAGGLLPPYDTRETLERLSDDIARYAPQTVLCLGDSFDDLDAADGLMAGDVTQLETLMAGQNWLWVEGNHDPGPVPFGNARTVAEHTLSGVTFRHIAQPGAHAEISGHYHPKARVGGRARACFLMDDTRLILPAYGTYTGGLACSDPAFDPLLSVSARAILTGKTMVTIPARR